MQGKHFHHQHQPRADLTQASLGVFKMLMVTWELPCGTLRLAVNPGSRRVVILTESPSIPQFRIQGRGNSPALVVEQNFCTMEVMLLTSWLFLLALSFLFQKASEGTGKANAILQSNSRQRFSVVLSETKRDQQVYEYGHRLLILSL